MSSNVGSVGIVSVLLSIIVLLAVFGILQWVHVPVGNFVDWAIAAASFWWLLAIVTVPWNVYFEAKEVIVEAQQSQEKQIPVSDRQVAYARSVAKRALPVAIVLHLLSAAGLYGLSVLGVSVVGYYGSAAALLLTLLRPAVRAYEYIYARLVGIRQGFKYPREDVVELRDRVTTLEGIAERLEYRLDAENPDSLAAQYQRELEAIRGDLTRLGSSVEDLRTSNQAQHQQLSREAKAAIAQLSEDSQFLEHVREIIRFFKSA